MSWQAGWDFSFGPVFGTAGSVTTITVAPQCDYRVEKVIASDTSSSPGQGVRIMQFVVGQRIQRPASGGSTLALFFGPSSIGNGLRWDKCDRGLSIAVTVSFVVDCTFDMSTFGSALV